MSDQDNASQDPKIIVDSDWKQEAANEKARLDEETADVGTSGPLPDPSLHEIIQMIIMQASIGLAGYKGPSGEAIPPDPRIAKHYIDLLELLRDKVGQNASDEEKKVMDEVLHQMRMNYVHTVSAPSQSATSTGESTA